MTNIIFDIIYTLLAGILLLIALPILLFASLKKKYKHSLLRRFFLIKNPSFDIYDIWFHVCSLGETKALAPLLERLQKYKIAISVTTQTGFYAAQQYRAQVRYLPYEIWLWFWIKSPRTIVVLEAEFWYLLFRIGTLRGGNVIALNARISERSYPKYYKLRWFYKLLFKQCHHIFCQSEEDKKRFLALGAKSVEVVGNIKLAQKVVQTKQYKKPNSLLIIAGSTHEGEEEGILKAYLAYKKRVPDAILVMVPRHPERFDKVAELIEKQTFNLEFTRWSQQQTFSKDITLIDAMGELNNLYAVADIAILGGAFMPIGGHNPLEPATFGCKIITGNEIFLQKELFKYVTNVQFVELNKLEQALIMAENMRGSNINSTIDLERVVDYLKN